VKNNQSLLIIVLLTLLLGSLGGVYYLNQKYNEAKSASLQNVAVFVADRNISLESQIKESDIRQINMPKGAVMFRPLTKQEIVGKYAKTPIYYNEPIIEDKLSAKIQVVTDTNLSAKNDRFNIRFMLFQNPNFNLKKGDKIDIVGVYKESKDNMTNDYKIVYTARSVKVLDFLRSGISQEKPVSKVENQKDKNAPQYVFAEELVLDMNAGEISKTLEILNKNNMIWMVLSGENRNDEALKKIESIVGQNMRPKADISVFSPRRSSEAVLDAPAVVYESSSVKAADKK